MNRFWLGVLVGWLGTGLATSLPLILLAAAGPRRPP